MKISLSWYISDNYFNFKRFLFLYVKMGHTITEISSNKSFGGFQKVFSHESEELKCTMKFGVYLPTRAEHEACPVIYYLSGLTCTEQNFIQKAGAQKYASEYGLIVVNPDTSPRGVNINGEDEKWNVGSGAGCYLDATQKPWSQHYRMYSYVTIELPSVIEKNFPVIPEQISIMGHSMGGHGALICALRNPGKYKSVSTFAPICDSVRCKYFKEAFSAYLEPDVVKQNRWNAIELAKTYNGPPLSILIDQGTCDEFFDELYLDEFTKTCAESCISVILNKREGYDHGYYFISTFIRDHFKYHAHFLQ